MMKSTKGQSTVEYILVVTAVIVVVLAATSQGGAFRSKLTSAIGTATEGMEGMASRLHATTNPP